MIKSDSSRAEKARNKRLASVYFDDRDDLDRARAAAAKLGISLTAFLRDAVVRRTREIIAA